MRRFVILDRDGTIIEDRHYLGDPGQVKLCPGAPEGLRRMAALGLGLVVLTNQSGLGRGFFDPSHLEAVNRRMNELLAAQGIRLDGVYVCPHRPDEDCSCRKPRTGLLERAAGELAFSPSEGFYIGDKPSDIDLGRRAGGATLLVLTGYGQPCVSQIAPPPDYVVRDLVEAAEAIRRLTAGGPAPATLGSEP